MTPQTVREALKIVCASGSACARVLALVLTVGQSLPALGQQVAPAPMTEPNGAAPAEAPAPPAAPEEAAPPAAPEATAGAPAPSVPAKGEEAVGSAGALQEIIITATRHSEAMSKVPVSVSAYSQEKLDVLGVKDFTDIAKYTPGVTIDSSGTNAISIRGISSSGGSGTTGIYIDDTPIQMRALGFNPDDTLPKTFDLDRVEVLRGPQGTLFGAGSEGGTVRYILAEPNMTKPSMYSRDEISFTQGGTASYEAGVAGGAPIIDNVLGFRASIWFRHDGGWIDRIDPFTLATVQNDANYDNTLVMRLAAKWAVNDAVTITPSIIFQDRRRNDISVFWPTVTGASGQVVTSNPGNNQYISADPTARPEPDRYLLPALKVQSDIGSATLISNTSFFNRNDLSGYDGTMYNLGYYQTVGGRSTTPGSNQLGNLTFLSDNLYPLIDQYGLHLPSSVQNYRAPATVTNDQKVFTEEVRLQSTDPDAPLTWTVGAFWQFTRQVSLEEIYDPMVDQLFEALFGTTATGPNAFGASCASGTCPLVEGGYSYYNHNVGYDRQLAGFGEVTYSLTDRVKLTVGARLAKTSFSFAHSADGTQNGGPSGNAGSEGETPFTPKLGLAFQADRNNLYYTTYAKGFRSGGDNAPIPQSLCPTTFAQLGLGNQSPPAYNSDSVNSFEIGAKNKIDNSLRLASSVYYITWDNIQQNIYLPGCGFQFTTNVGNAVAKGFDVQADWAPNEALSFESAIGYTQARFTGDAFLTAGAQFPIARTGDAITGESDTPAPPWTVTLGAQYSFHAFDHASFVRMDYEYQSKNHTRTAAQDPGVSPTVYDPYSYNPPSTTQVSLRAGTTVDRWNISAFIDNLLDAHPLLPPSSYAHSDVDPNANVGQGVLVRNYTFRPRTFGLTTVYHF